MITQGPCKQVRQPGASVGFESMILANTSMSENLGSTEIMPHTHTRLNRYGTQTERALPQTARLLEPGAQIACISTAEQTDPTLQSSNMVRRVARPLAAWYPSTLPLAVHAGSSEYRISRRSVDSNLYHLPNSRVWICC